MDVCKRLKLAKTFQNYIEISEEIASKSKCLQNVQLNMSTIIALKNVRCFEIEYFNKCDGNGATFKVLEKLFELPASKTWHILGKEIISLVQYWLDAVRKHLITHNINWWSFLKQLLVFIKQLIKKDPSLNNILIEEAAESLLDLSTNGKLDVTQRHAVLHTFNLFSADSCRKIRLAYRSQFEHYFIRLAAIMSTCGHIPTQYSIIETLLRWLLPRQDQALRRELANKWFPQHLYKQSSVSIFLERQWMNFFQDARDFLNSHNENDELITSVVCRKLSVGNINILSGTERRQTWLDINSTSNCMSVLLDPLLLEAAGAPNYTSCEALVISSDNAVEVKLYRDSMEVTLLATTTSTPQVLPSNLDIFDQERAVKIVVSSRGNLMRVDNALRAVFHDKYQVLLDFANLTCLSPLTYTGSKMSSREEETRFSIPAKEVRRKQGYVVKSRRPDSCKSPSTTSTTSLAQLHDKLAALPSYIFDKEIVSVCVRPELSNVTEIAESEYSLNSTTSTLKLRPGGYWHRKRDINNKNSQSDSELVRNLDIIQEEAIKQSQTLKSSQSDVEDVIYKREKPKDDRANSSLFVATIGSADESVINATLERLPKNKELNTDNLIELLVQEALQTKGKEAKVSDSYINTGDGNKQDLEDYSEAIENTPSADVDTAVQRKQKERTAVYKSTSDESNTEAINDTPMTYVSLRKKNLRKKSAVIDEEVVVAPENSTYDVQTVKDFSHHCTESKTGDLITSPTFARKINETSSDTSEDFEQCLISNVNVNINIDDFHDLDVIDCLNSILDKVCSIQEVDDNQILNIVDHTKLNKIMHLRNIGIVNKQEEPKKCKGKGKGQVKLRYSMKKPKPKPKKATKNKLSLESVSKMSTILEVNTETDISVTKNTTDNRKSVSSDSKNNVDNSVIRRKRKLYSPKNDIIAVENVEFERQEILNNDSSKSDDDVVKTNFNKDKTVTPKSAATCYRELEKERQKYKIIRTRRSKCKNEVSPKTKKLNDVFNNLKVNIESEEKVILADKKSAKDFSIYNYTSDSEDEDFRQKKNDLQKKTSTTTVASGKSIVSTRRGRAVNKVNYIEDCRESSTDTNKKPSRKRKKVTKRNTRSKKVVKEELIDERMRKAAPESLETSFVVKKDGKNKKDEYLVPVINVPEIENIPEDLDVEKSKPIDKSKVLKQIKKSKKIHAVEKQKALQNAKEVKLNSDKEDERTISPLPGLLVETVKDKPNLDDSLTTNMVQKFKRIHQEGANACNETNITNTTQNLLSDNDRASPPMNITEEFNRIEKEISMTKICKIPSVNAVEDLPITDVEDRPKRDDSSSSKKLKRSLRLKSRIPSVIENSLQEENVEKSKSRTKEIIGNLEKILKTDNVRTEESKSKTSSQKNKTEIVHIDTEKSTKTKSKSKEKCQQIESLSISDITEMKSEKSIATVGITGHGDFDELPPCPESLKLRYFPREAVDMEASIKEYYVKLHHQVNLNSTGSSNSRGNFDIRKKNSDEISIKTSTPQKKDKVQRQKSNNKIWLRSRKNASSSYGKSVSVSITRMSSKDISKLPSRQNSSGEDLVPNLSNDDLRKWLPSPRSSDTDISKTSSVKFPFKRPTKNVERNIVSSRDTKRKSNISPIKLCDESSSTNSKPATRHITKNDTLTARNTKDTIQKLGSVKKYITRSVSKESREFNISKLIEFKSPAKRKCGPQKFEGKKRMMDVQETVDVSSAPSVSSVDDWFKRNTLAVGQADNIGSSQRDIVQNVIEKLETTLSEIHQDTCKNFIHLFVDAQKELLDLKSQRQDMYKQTAINILTRVRNVIDEEFMDLDKRSHEKDDHFTSWLKQQATEFIKMDCRKKRAMVQLLKEDAEAVLEHFKRAKPPTQ